ncbi:MAG: hypothetical protein KDA87_23810, partial [Planctomycetales bacterium]|nr:hypothetical protein [Planctomycetales bacterium]
MKKTKTNKSVATLQRIPRLEALDSRIALSATTWETEPNDRESSATAFVVPEDGQVTLMGDSTSDKDKDFFVFQAPQGGGTVQIQVNSSNGNSPQLTLENRTTSVEVFETEPNDNINGGTVVLDAGTQYFIRLRSKNDHSAQYQVQIVFEDANSTGNNSGNTGGNSGSNGSNTGGSGNAADMVDEAEPNGDKSQANAIDLGLDGTIQLRGTSDSSDDRDYFRFTAASSGTLQAEVQTTNGNFAALEVENTQSVNILETEPNDGVNSASGTVVAGQTYFVRLRSPNGSAAGYIANLSLNATNNGGGTNTGGNNNGGSTGGNAPTGTIAESESNDSKSSADAFAVNHANAARLTGTVADRNDEDFFRFTATESGRIRIAVSSPSGNLAKLEVEDQLGNNILETEPNDGVNADSGMVQAGVTYFVRLRTPNDSAAEYAVDVAFQELGDSNDDGVFNT